MEEVEQQIINSLSEVRDLVKRYKSISEQIQIEKNKLSHHARHIQKERALCEQQAMFLEDCIGHAPSRVINIYKQKDNYTNITKEEARNNLLSILEQEKLNTTIKMRNQQMNQEIDQMMEKISSQHQLLIKEETLIAKLREKESRDKQRETEQFQALMQKLNEASDEFQVLHNENKKKKNQLLQIENSNNELRKKIDIARADLLKSNESIKQTRNITRELTERRQNSQARSIQITKSERHLNKIRNENANLSKEEIKLNETLGKLSVKFDDKKAFLLRIFTRIEDTEQLIDYKIDDKTMKKHAHSGLK